MILTPGKLEGVFEISLGLKSDQRGSLLKIWGDESLTRAGLPSQWPETFVTKSRRGVLRGMHYQAPPEDHEKIITVIEGEILDVSLDLRRRSRTFGQHYAIRLSALNPLTLFLPKGIAHGFAVLSENATVHYQISRLYHPELDQGILWSSFGFCWPGIEFILSDRDKTHPPFNPNLSPFV